MRTQKYYSYNNQIGSFMYKPSNPIKMIHSPDVTKYMLLAL